MTAELPQNRFELDQEPNQFRTEIFLRKLQRHFPIELIYYPGSASDTTLENAFPINSIVYVEKEPEITHNNHFKNSKRRVLQADFAQSPIKNNTFDAIFFQDNHASQRDFEEMLRTLKPGGIVIMGKTCIGEMTKETAAAMPQLTRVELPFRHKTYVPEFELIVLQKQREEFLN